jgi:hypothetical protein
LPAIDSTTVLSADRRRYSLTTNIANNYTIVQRADEDLWFDGETTRVAFSYTQGLGDDFEWSIGIPYISHDGGFLDGFIEDWHDTFGLPQDGRDRTPRNQLSYRYSRYGRTLLEVASQSSGIGDVRLGGALQWFRAKRPGETNLALRTLISLPTGDSDQLMGSGGIDAAFWLSADRATPWFDYPGAVWGGTGILLLGEGDVLAEMQRDAALFGSIGAGAKIGPTLSLKLQLDFHTTMYNHSRLKQLNGNAVQLTMGGEIAISKTSRLDLAVKEDPTVGASPDVVFYIGLTVDH